MADKQAKIVNNIYAALVAIICLQFVPIIAIQIVSSILFMALFISFYVLRSKNEAGSLVENHMTFLIRTIWIGSLYMMVGLVVGGLIYNFYADHSYLIEFMDNYKNGYYGLDFAGMLSDYNQMIINYTMDNKNIALISMSIIFAPSVIYMIFRIAKGLTRAVKGHRLKNPKSWF